MKRLIPKPTLLSFNILALGGLLFLGVSSPVWAATINVPGDFATIQAAIVAANPGDTIIVGAATFTENLVLNKRLKIQGAWAGENACETRAGGESVIDSTGVQLDLKGGSAGSIIDGFTFSGATGLGAIISSSGPIDNVQILNNIIIKRGH